MSRKSAIITGAGSGIGRAVAHELHARGWALTLAGRRAAQLAEAAPPGARVVPTDVTDPAAVAALFATAERVDMLFNNAGTNTPTRPIDETAPEAHRDVIATNLLGAIFCAREAFAAMREHGGRIINNGSVAAHAPRPNSPAYTAAKHGITGLTKSLILDGRAFGITATQIDIGNAATERTEKMAAGVAQADGSIRPEPRLDLAVVARQIADIADMPNGVTIPFLTIMPTGMPLYGRG